MSEKKKLTVESLDFARKKNFKKQCSSSSSSSSGSLAGMILDPMVSNELIRQGNAAAGTCTGVKFQNLPASVRFFFLERKRARES